MIGLLQVRMISPTKSAGQFGYGALLLLVFLNNCIPVFLSFVYPFLIIKIDWKPPLTAERTRALLGYYTSLCALLLGFFGLGAPLSIGLVVGGVRLLLVLLKNAWLHGPLEITAVLLCVSEPLRLTKRECHIDLISCLREDLRLLVICSLILFLSAIIEVFTRV